MLSLLGVVLGLITVSVFYAIVTVTLLELRKTKPKIDDLDED